MRALTSISETVSERPGLQLLRSFIFFSLTLFALLGMVDEGQAKGPRSVADIAEGLQEAVVNISTTQTLKGVDHVPLPNIPQGSPFEEFFRDFFERQGRNDRPHKVSSLGSGFVIDPKGLIVTNYHVIKDADEIIIKFTDGHKLKVVKVLGHDQKSDLALLQVKPQKPLKAIKFGNSDKMRIGDWVMAIGNPFGLGGSLTVGVVSATKRDINAGLYDNFIQTDAAINRGNSGGPLFNMDGEVIGVNSAIISPSGGSIGIGFAIPANTAKRVVRQLEKFGEVKRGWLGVRIQTVSETIAQSLGLAEPIGALIASVTANGPADEAGIKAGDVVLRFNGVLVKTMRQLPKIVSQTPLNKDVDVIVMRNGKRKTLRARVGLLDEAKLAAQNRANKPEIRVRRQDMLGLTLAQMTPALRSRYHIDEAVSGVVITQVRENSIAQKKGIEPGNVVVEVNQEEVTESGEIVAIVQKLIKKGRKHVLLLLADAAGELRFVAVPTVN
ncbi:MAG: Do family serine endopeptidase [Hyphomicrobiaceae bacterium]|nr:Do family serine endopeptidase [Hyphomicrobiaceae bacterium]